MPSGGKDEKLTDSYKGRQKYKDVADAAQAAFESAAYAAAAARAALELSRSESHDPDDHDSPSLQPRKGEDGHDNVRPQLEDKEILSETETEEFNNDVDEFKKSKDIISCNSIDEVLKGATASVDAKIEADPLEEQVIFDDSDDETDNKQNRNQYSKQTPSGYDAGIVLNTVPASKMQQSVPQLDLQKRPISVRTR